MTEYPKGFICEPDSEEPGWLRWRIADPTQYYRSTGGQEIVAADRLSGILNSGLRGQFGSRTIQQAINSDRISMMQSLEKEAKARKRGAWGKPKPVPSTSNP